MQQEGASWVHSHVRVREPLEKIIAVYTAIKQERLAYVSGVGEYGQRQAIRNLRLLCRSRDVRRQERLVPTP